VLVRAFAPLAVLLTPASACAEDPARTLHELLVQYRCPVVDRLEQIFKAAPSSHPQNLFLIVSFAARPDDYVQCVFDPLTYMFCEVASGFYDNVASEPRTRLCPRAPAPRSPASDFRLTTRREIFGSASK
jgi:hypothetical protein